jgi:hypothetical protein
MPLASENESLAKAAQHVSTRLGRLPWLRRVAMTRSLRIAFTNAPTALVLLAGAAQNTVLCLGPGNHCHLETFVGASCGEQLPISDSSAPAPRDGCPKGSKDLRLGVDTHRSDNTSVIAAFAPVLAVATGVLELSKLSHQKPCPSRFPRTQEARILTIVLRC